MVCIYKDLVPNLIRTSTSQQRIQMPWQRHLQMPGGALTNLAPRVVALGVAGAMLGLECTHSNLCISRPVHRPLVDVGRPNDDVLHSHNPNFCLLDDFLMTVLDAFARCMHSCKRQQTSIITCSSWMHDLGDEPQCCMS